MPPRALFWPGDAPELQLGFRDVPWSQPLESGQQGDVSFAWKNPVGQTWLEGGGWPSLGGSGEEGVWGAEG